MAKKENKQDDKNTTSDPKPAGSKPGILIWIIMVVIIASLTGSGFVLGRLFAGSITPQTKPDQAAAKQAPAENQSSDTENNTKETWYYDLEPIVANLNEPGAMRYIRASITLEIYASWERIKAEKTLELQNPRLRSWLAIYLAGLNTEDATGPQNQRRIQLEILDSFNGILFPDSKPQIKQILFKQGLAIQ